MDVDPDDQAPEGCLIAVVAAAGVYVGMLLGSLWRALAASFREFE